MPMQKLSFRPGVNTQLSTTSNESGWSDSNLIRFRDGLPQKLGGWVRAVTAALTGTPRASLTWQELGGALNAAFGTNSVLQLLQGDVLFDITPYRRAVTLTNPFQTASGSAVVTVLDVGHGTSPGDAVVLAPAVMVGGVMLGGSYPVLSVLSANSYTIMASSAATSAAFGGGTVVASYVLPAGANDAAIANGFGVGPYGASGYGTARSSTTLTLNIRQWSLANWGEILLALPRGYQLSAWLPSGGTGTRATVVTNATPSAGPPGIANFMLIGMPERHCILLGTSSLGTTAGYDPMLVRFSDVEDYSTYQATATNSAGSFRLQGGTRLISGLNTTNQTLLWSDTDCFSMRFVGLPYVYRFDRIGAGCGIIGTHAMADHIGTVYWMGRAGFYRFQGGAPELLQCPVWQTIFDSLPTAVDQTQADKVTCGVCIDNNEIWWFYPSRGQNGRENDRYVKFNFTENLWDIGSLDRSTWLDRGVWQQIIATSPTGVVYYQEQGVDAAGAPMNSYIESGYQDIGDGGDFAFVDQIIPDFGTSQSGNVFVTIKVTDFPNRPPKVIGPHAMSPDKAFISPRARGRQVATRFETTELGADFRLGAVRARIAASGRK